ncbi:hypothetical protein SS50377_25190 [Spironucleus salmonicida]|uniref:Uncharacterized protein n=1 Tax=Spironucleus salmonicida TaxID=348837 RepID=V6M108_9EUKA|nr:hypothetical protein SS50377_25190 [Spironucleus salmonicida]|eukprot:EST46849.1 Hypothetical protein SS50377_13113 [Spironucleus salmonicida]
MGGRVSKITEQADEDIEVLVKIHSQKQLVQCEFHQVMSMPQKMNQYCDEIEMNAFPSQKNFSDNQALNINKIQSLDQFLILQESHNSITVEAETSIWEEYDQQ